jgi:tRNA (guanine-N7-)-methyltransferase
MRKPKAPIPDNPLLPDRPDWPELFDRPTKELHLEIGSGHGGFALAFAAQHPEVDFVAMEWRKKFADWTRARAVQRGLRNLLVVRADARVEVPRLFAEASIDCVHLQFPDPWWKRRHQKRRVLDETFAPLLWSRLRPGGLLEVRTDVSERGDEMREVLEAAGFVNLAGAGRFSERPEGEIPSTREKRYLAAGEPVFRLRFTRVR